eukprot:1036572-Prorocentrum_minimum.AAC.1
MNKHARGGFIGRMRGPGFAEIGGSVNRTARSVERKSFRRFACEAKRIRPSKRSWHDRSGPSWSRDGAGQERMDKTTKAETVLNGPQMAIRDI